MKKFLAKMALAGIAGSFAVVLQPWWAGGFRVGFFAALIFTLLHIVIGHAGSSEEN